jgi:hypothetical protein
MKLTRQARLAAAVLTLLSMLFMQLAVAAYACPDLKMSEHHAMSSITMDHAVMPGCHDMDKQQRSLCHAHADVGNQSLDKPEIPQVQPFVALDLVAALVPADHAFAQLSLVTSSNQSPPAGAPPLSIRHCCFRL